MNNKKKIDLIFMKTVFSKALNLKNFNLKINSKYENVPNWDSLGHMKIISELESRMKIEFDIDEIIGKDTVQKLIEMVNKKLK